MAAIHLHRRVLGVHLTRILIRVRPPVHPHGAAGPAHARAVMKDVGATNRGRGRREVARRPDPVTNVRAERPNK